MTLQSPAIELTYPSTDATEASNLSMNGSSLFLLLLNPFLLCRCKKVLLLSFSVYLVVHVKRSQKACGTELYFVLVAPHFCQVHDLEHGFGEEVCGRANIQCDYQERTLTIPDLRRVCNATIQTDVDIYISHNQQQREAKQQTHGKTTQPFTTARQCVKTQRWEHQSVLSERCKQRRDMKGK